jgi:hypothetical protein
MRQTRDAARDCLVVQSRRGASCRVCGEGPCRIVPPAADLVPNRLKGVTINHEGDAV